MHFDPSAIFTGQAVGLDLEPEDIAHLAAQWLLGDEFRGTDLEMGTTVG